MTTLSSRDNHLRTFVAIAKSGSLREAADVLGVTQAALSKQIRALELALGKQLFRRCGRGMELTLEGHGLHRKIEPLLSGIDAVCQECLGYSSATLRISTIQTLTGGFVPWLGRQLREAYSDANLVIACDSSAGVVESVERGKADIGFVYESAVDVGDMTAIPVAMHRLALYAQAGAEALEKPLAELPDACMILPPRQFAVRRMAERAAGRNVQPGIECDSAELSLGLVKSCGGVTLLPDDISFEMVEARGLGRRTLPEIVPRQIVAILRHSCALSPIVRDALALASGGPPPQPSRQSCRATSGPDAASDEY